MSDRDLIIERLESKLAEKEKEIRELRKVASMSVEEIKEAVLSEIRDELEKLKMKVTELNKTVESMMSEILYIKAEVLKKEVKPREIREIGSKKEDEGEKEDKDSKIIICD